MTTSHTGPSPAPPGTSAFNIDLPDDLPPETQAQIAAFLEEWEQETKTGGDVLKALQRIQRRKSDALIKDAVQRSRAGETDWGSLCDGLGRNDAPTLLFDLVYLDKSLDVTSAPGAVASAWSDPDSPERTLGTGTWIELFQRLATPTTATRPIVHRSRSGCFAGAPPS